MAKKKVEPKIGARRYASLMSAAEQAESQGLVMRAVDCAVSAWDYLDASLRYKPRTGRVKLETISSMEIVLHYAPLLLDFAKLDSLETVLKTTRRISRKIRGSLTEKLKIARARIRDNHRYWTYLEAPGGILETEIMTALGGDDTYWHWLSNAWTSMGILERIPHDQTFALALAAPLHQIVPGKCPACGKISQAPKAVFLEPTNCPACYQPVSFCLIKTIN